MIRPLLLLALAAACGSPRTGPPAARPADPRAPLGPSAASAPPGSLAETGRPPGTPPGAELRQQMLAHFAAVSALARAVVLGQLEEARRQARWLLDHDEPLAEGWQPFVDEVRAGALAVAEAPDLPTAGAVTARIGRACSRCHEARAAAVGFAWEPEPAEAPTVAAQMQRHQWAAARLWEGLVGPSDEMWAEGSRVMAGTRLDLAKIAPGAPRGDLAALAGAVRDLAQRAAAVTHHDERSALYGELLATCAGCHVLARDER